VIWAKTKEITIMVKQEMELDSPLRLAEGGPIKESGTKVDDGGVKAEELVLEAELLSRGNGPALAKKLIKHFLIELPGPFLISIGQRGPGGGQSLCRDVSTSPDRLRGRHRSHVMNVPDPTGRRAWQRTGPQQLKPLAPFSLRVSFTAE